MSVVVTQAARRARVVRALREVRGEHTMYVGSWRDGSYGALGLGIMAGPCRACGAGRAAHRRNGWRCP